MGVGVEPESVVGELYAAADVGHGVVVGGGIRMAAVASVQPAMGLRRIDRVGLRLWNREEHPGMVGTGLKGVGVIPHCARVCGGLRLERGYRLEGCCVAF